VAEVGELLFAFIGILAAPGADLQQRCAARSAAACKHMQRVSETSRLAAAGQRSSWEHRGVNAARI